MDAIHQTIAVGGTAEVVDLDADYDVVEIVNEETGANISSIFATVGSVDDDPAVPVADARGTIQLRPGERRAIRPLGSGASRVRLVCADTEPYSVYGFTIGEWIS